MQTACDKKGWIPGYSVHSGNLYGSRTFKPLMAYKQPMTKEGFFKNMSTFMMSIMTAMSDQAIR